MAEQQVWKCRISAVDELESAARGEYANLIAHLSNGGEVEEVELAEICNAANKTPADFVRDLEDAMQDE